MRGFLLGFALLLVSCGSSDDDGGGGEEGGECFETADDCTGDTICIAGVCEAAFGRLYDVTDIQVTVPTRDPAGLDWDFGGGAPDLFAQVVVGGEVFATTAVVSDAFAAVFAGPYSVQVIGGGSLAIVVYDEDVAVSDRATACQADPLTAGLLRRRALQCSGTSPLMFGIAPR
jgi:hypothetical protein